MGLFDNFKKAEVCLLVERQQRSDLATCMHIPLQEKCPPMIPMQWGLRVRLCSTRQNVLTLKSDF